MTSQRRENCNNNVSSSTYIITWGLITSTLFVIILSANSNTRRRCDQISHNGDSPYMRTLILASSIIILVKYLKHRHLGDMILFSIVS